MTQQVDVGDSLTTGGTVATVVSTFYSYALMCACLTSRHTMDMLEVQR